MVKLTIKKKEMLELIITLKRMKRVMVKTRGIAYGAATSLLLYWEYSSAYVV